MPDSNTVVRSIGGGGNTTNGSVGAGGDKIKYQRITNGVVLETGQQRPYFYLHRGCWRFCCVKSNIFSGRSHILHQAVIDRSSTQSTEVVSRCSQWEH